MTREELDLLHGYLNDTLGGVDFALLQSLLRGNVEGRRVLRSLSTVEVKLQHIAAADAVPLQLMGPRETVKPTRWLSWSPLTAAAAGLMIGLFSASLVFGYVAQSRARSVTMLAEGFEDAEMPLDRDLPRRTGAWSGDFTRPHAGNGSAKPLEGSRLVTLPPGKERKFSYAMRFFDLGMLPASETAQNRQIEVTASFHGHEPAVADLFQIRLAAFGGSLEEARAIWLSPQLNEKALLHVARTVTVPAGEGGWKKLHATIDLPPGATLLLVSLAAAVADNDVPKTPHYLDDVRIQLHTMKMDP
jgi:hypothetical protein